MSRISTRVRSGSASFAVAIQAGSARRAATLAARICPAGIDDGSDRSEVLASGAGIGSMACQIDLTQRALTRPGAVRSA